MGYIPTIGESEEAINNNFISCALDDTQRLRHPNANTSIWFNIRFQFSKALENSNALHVIFNFKAKPSIMDDAWNLDLHVNFEDSLFRSFMNFLLMDRNTPGLNPSTKYLKTYYPICLTNTL